MAVVLGLVGWWMGVTVSALLYYTSYYHYVFCSRWYYYYYYYYLRGCIFEALSIKLILEINSRLRARAMAAMAADALRCRWLPLRGAAEGCRCRGLAWAALPKTAAAKGCRELPLRCAAEGCR